MKEYLSELSVIDLEQMIKDLNKETTKESLELLVQVEKVFFEKTENK